MKNIEQNLSSLPKMKLSRLRSLRIRFKLYYVAWEMSWLRFNSSFSYRRLAVGSMITVLCLVIIAALPVYAYASENVAPDSPLYFLKRSVEKVEIAITPDKAKPELFMKLAERRLTEANTLAKRGNDEHNIILRISAVKEAQQEEQKALAEANNRIASSSTDKLATQAIGLHTKVSDTVKKIANDVTLNMKGEVINNVAAMLEDQSNDPVPAPTPDNTPSIQATGSLPEISQPEISKSGISATQTPPQQITADNTGIGALSGVKQSRHRSPINKRDNVANPVPASAFAFGDVNKPAISQETSDIVKRFNALKTDFSSLEPISTLKPANSSIPGELLGRLKKKMDNAEQKIRRGKIHEADAIISSTEALKDFTKHLFGNRSSATSTEPAVAPQIKNTVIQDGTTATSTSENQQRPDNGHSKGQNGSKRKGPASIKGRKND